MKKCDKCGSITEDGYFSCPNCMGNLSILNPSPEEQRQLRLEQQSELDYKKRELEYKQKLLSVKLSDVRNHMLTTGYSFYGYYIAQYCGIVSGQVIIGTGFLAEVSASFADLIGGEANRYGDKMSQAREAVLDRIIKDSIVHGGNAIIGIDFDYTVFAGNMIGVSASGTSVFIQEKE